MHCYSSLLHFKHLWSKKYFVTGSTPTLCFFIHPSSYAVLHQYLFRHGFSPVRPKKLGFNKLEINLKLRRIVRYFLYWKITGNCWCTNWCANFTYVVFHISFFSCFALKEKHLLGNNKKINNCALLLILRKTSLPDVCFSQCIVKVWWHLT